MLFLTVVTVKDSDLNIEVSVLHNVAMLTLIVPKSDSVSVLRESFAAFEERWKHRAKDEQMVGSVLFNEIPGQSLATHSCNCFCCDRR